MRSPQQEQEQEQQDKLRYEIRSSSKMVII